MKRYIYILLVVEICVFVLLFISCKRGHGKENMTEVFFDEYVANDSISLESAITKKYEINELKSFFDGKNANENACFNTTEPELLFSDVDQQYPIEVIRSRGYSVYQVTQGGYFYVFWVKPLVSEMNQEGAEPVVYFSAYLSSPINISNFDSIVIGISTAEDVKKIDPYCEISFLNSNGIFSYSFLNNESILEIEYATKDRVDGYDDLIVKGMTIISRKNATSRYSTILSEDLPN